MRANPFQQLQKCGSRANPRYPWKRFGYVDVNWGSCVGWPLRRSGTFALARLSRLRA